MTSAAGFLISVVICSPEVATTGLPAKISQVFPAVLTVTSALC
jgi:hypothetical protein